MPERRPLITLTTDFGLADPFVGVMKGVILGIEPAATVIDLTHAIPPQDIAAGAHHLGNAWGRFPRGTIHVAVVDPGVGSSRRALAVAASGHLFVAPDNGLLTRVLAESEWRAHEISEPHYMARSRSATFHGRDLFAPAAAHLARGVGLENLGPRVNDPVRLELDAPRREGDVVRSRVVHIDRFGNLVLNVSEAQLRAWGGPPAAHGIFAELAERKIDGLVTHYAEAKGSLCMLINSDGWLEIARPGGSAARELGLARGSEVLLRLGPPSPADRPSR